MFAFPKRKTERFGVFKLQKFYLKFTKKMNCYFDSYRTIVANELEFFPKLLYTIIEFVYMLIRTLNNIYLLKFRKCVDYAGLQMVDIWPRVETIMFSISGVKWKEQFMRLQHHFTLSQLIRYFNIIYL